MPHDSPSSSDEDALISRIHRDVLQAIQDGQTVDLQEICASRPDLLPKIEKLLRMDGFQERLDLSAAHVASTPSNPLPTEIDRYQIVKRLGRGAFGTVYQAYDPQLDRSVAVKVLLTAGARQVEQYLREARLVARLEHPGIVRVYDCGQTQAGLCWITSQLLEGGDLADRMKQTRLTAADAADLIARVADALHFAHKQFIIHRDVKPSNILLDKTGAPCLADFGLALREQDFGQGSGFTGTPRYMSPEQARGEGHRVDGRSDIYSLGVVLYELLSGRVPFITDRITDLLDQIQNREPPPLRLTVEKLPAELERIVLKCLAKRARDRYVTAADFAEDLRFWLKPGSVGAQSITTLVAAGFADATSSKSARVVPKGLRAFDASDADFFLRLLPGVRGRDGLPESIRFWKARLESRDAEIAFPVGLLYGPSGSGKSSFLRAGLLPNLSRSLTVILLDATAQDTEARLVTALRKEVADTPQARTLVETLAALRRQSPGKVVIILDQFEQWLATHPDDPNAELLLALRQCDGTNLQALLLVRDDFWMAATRTFDALETPLAEGKNSAPIDLFDRDHARKVLVFFGRAYGKLPNRREDITAEQNLFLDQAVQGLTDAFGRVICVRLAVFAEMVKGKPWEPKTLADLGGLDGVGVSFLEDTFSNRTAPPSHRRHEEAARKVLQALLPPPGSDIKKTTATRDVLRAASGCDNDADFDALLAILDSELRLITPTESDTAGHYQLTHDFLVPSLREWLLRKQKETKRGRTEILLEERTALWTQRPLARFLPSLGEWLQIRLYTKSSQWTDVQKRLMKSTARRQLFNFAMIGTFLVAAISIGIILFKKVEHDRRQMKAAYIVKQISDASVSRLPSLIDEFESQGELAEQLLIEQYTNEEDPQARLQMEIVLNRNKPEKLVKLLEPLKDSDPLKSYGSLRLLQNDLISNATESLLLSRDEGLPAVIDTFRRQPGIGHGLRMSLSQYNKMPVTPDNIKAVNRLSLTLASLDDYEPLFDIFGKGFNNDRTNAIWGECKKYPINISSLVSSLQDKDDRRKALAILLMAEHDDQAMSCVVEWLRDEYTKSESPLVHASIDRLSRKGNNALTHGVFIAPDAVGLRRWVLLKSGHTLVLFKNDKYTFMMGDPHSNRKADKNQHPRTIGRSFALGSHEITVKQFLELVPEHRNEWLKNPQISPSEDGAITGISWVQAALYCNRLSKKEGIPEAQWCYDITTTDNSISVTIKENILTLTGYRLPTESEWEYAARGGSNTSRHFGDSAQFLPHYAWFLPNSEGRVHPPGELLPNEYGLFDMLGNASEWTLTAYDPKFSDYPEGGDEAVNDQWREIDANINNGLLRVIRGGCYYDRVEDVRCARRFGFAPDQRPEGAGFRLARTLTVKPSSHK